MRSPRAFLVHLILFLGLLPLMVSLTGCGGGGGHPGPSVSFVRIAIDWPARSRDVTAVSSALSALIIVKGSAADGSDFTFGENRKTTDPSAYTGTYTSSGQTRVGTWPLQVKFYAQPNATGDVVAVANGQIPVPSQYGNITNVTTTGTIKNVTIPAGQIVLVGQHTDLAFSTTDANGTVIAVTPGSAFFKVVTGTSALQIDQNGQATGVAPGTATVTVTVDGITSAAQTVTVAPATSITLTPDSASLPTGGTQTFTATVNGISSQSVTWSVQEGQAGGTITGGGVYTAPSTSGTYHVVATSTVNNQVTGTAVVTVFLPGRGPIYIADKGNHRIDSMLDMLGTNFSTVGSIGNGVGRLLAPVSIAIGPDNRIYVADQGNNYISRLDNMQGNPWVNYGSPGSGSGQFNGPRGIIVAADNRIYVADQNNNRIVRMDDITGKNWIAAGIQGSGVGEFNAPAGVFVTQDGHIYIADQGNNRIVRMDDMQGTNWVTLGSLGSGTGQFNAPSALCVGSDGAIYVADQNNNRIVRVKDMTGAGWQSVSSHGTTNVLNAPTGVWVAADGRIYVADQNNNRIVRMNDITGAGWTNFGTQGSGLSGQFEAPSGVFVR